MDIKDIKVLIKIVTESDITDFEMESGGEKLVIRRGQAPVMVAAPAPQVVAAPVPAAAPSVLPAAAAAPAVPEAAPTGKGSADERYETVVSPIVGTFFRSPSPDSDAYVEVGSDSSAAWFRFSRKTPRRWNSAIPCSWWNLFNRRPDPFGGQGNAMQPACPFSGSI